MARFSVRLATGAACLALAIGALPGAVAANNTSGESAATTASAQETKANAATVAEDAGLLPYETFQLENGLTVVFHVDRSDPVVAVNLTAHVGSARELPGRTGFAHLFEHLLFLESENLGKGGLDR